VKVDVIIYHITIKWPSLGNVGDILLTNTHGEDSEKCSQITKYNLD